MQVHMDIFVHQAALFSHFNFLSILEGKLFSGFREKTPGFYYLFSFFPTQLNTLQKNFHSHFLSKVFHPSCFTSEQTHPKSICTFKKLYFKHQNACFIQTWVLKNIYNKLSKLQIWIVNPQKLAPAVSLIHCSLAKNCLLMNSSSLGLMTYYSLAKELMGIKNSTHPLKYLILLNNHNDYNSTILDFFSLKHL